MRLNAGQNAIIAIGHEVAHLRGVDTKVGNLEHPNANRFGYEMCQNAGEC